MRFDIIAVMNKRAFIFDLNGTAVDSPVEKLPSRTLVKEHAIAKLLKILSVEKDRSVGVGDGYNDVHLFNAVGYKVAMGNAVPELKARADIIIGSVKEDGLAQYLKTL